jgi:pimeloyl-ACP methyl ester carboxylesterase
MTATATRVDEQAGIREEAAYFGPDAAQLYGCLHTPLDRRPVGGLVMCCSIHAELQESYRLDVLLGRTLAGRGIAVQRFHYRGSGHSDGASEDLTFDAMREDALAAVERLTEQTGVSTVALMGARLGGLVAASVVRGLDGAPLVLWAPTLASSRYFREAVRAHMIHKMRDRAAGSRRGGSPMEELRTTGVLDILGYPIHRAFYDSASDRTLLEELGEAPRRLLLVQLDGGSEPNPEYAKLTEQLEPRGVAIDLQIVPEQPAWWFAGGTGEGLARLGDGIGDWLLGRMEGVPP